jgi:hypothetical protein
MMRVLTCAAGVCCSLATQTNWQFRPAAVRPSPRHSAVLVHDESRGVTVLFGGYGLPPHDETWEWDGTTWALRNTTVQPAGREGAASGWDQHRRRVVVFGGAGVPSLQSLGDTWEWNGSQWFQYAGAVSPAPRVMAGMAYDEERRVVVLFGGRVSMSSGNVLGDTWTYDGAIWRQVLAGASPQPRGGAGMYFDKRRKQVVLFGGFASNQLMSDLWAWDGQGWSALTQGAVPPPRLARVSYDWNRERVVMFGGGRSGGVLGDTWEFDGMQWHQRIPSAGPPGLELHALAYDSRRSCTILFGGRDGTLNGERADTWEYASVNLGHYESYSAGCGGLFGVPLLQATVSSPYIGHGFDLRVDNLIPLSPGALAFGLSRTAFDLGGFGMPGCTLAVTWDLPIAGSAGPTGSRLVSVPIPQDYGLLGQRFVNQLVSLDPQANPRGLVVSNACEGTVGEK